MFIQNFSSSERVIAYKKAHFTFIEFLNIQIVLKDSNSINYLTAKSFGTSGGVNLGCELTLVQKHVFLFCFKKYIDITSVLPKVQVSIDSDHETMLGHY